MIARLIHTCVRNRALVVLLILAVVAAGLWSVTRTRVDAIPDLSDVQVIIRTEYPGQAPQIVEEQVTYPLTTAMLAVPHASVVRGYSMVGTSFVYVIFTDGTDPYWARSRVLEQLSVVAGRLPAGATAQLGPDATGVGWIFEYVMVTGAFCPRHPNGLWHDPEDDAWYADPAHAPVSPERLVRHRVFNDGTQTCPLGGETLEPNMLDLADLRRLQDWYLRYELTAVQGVSEVAAVGGFVKQYQVVVDPVKLLAYGLAISNVKTAISRSNLDVGGRLIEVAEAEYMVRGLGYLGGLTDKEIADARRAGLSVDRLRSERVLEQLAMIALGTTDQGAPVYLRDVADVRLGPEIRRGIAEWNGEGETVGGIIVMRFGENARATIDRVRSKLTDLERGLPPGVAIEVAYDRGDLIDRAVGTLSRTLLEEMIVVTLICLLFLLHARSALVAVFVLPTGVLATLFIMNEFGVNANIMSLGGIAIAIGVMVDSSVVMVENAHKHFEIDRKRIASGGSPRPRSALVAEAAVEVGPSLFFSLLIITVSFLPVFALGEQSGRLFRPLAITKTLAMATSAIFAVTIIPVLMVYLISERTVPRTWSPGKRLVTYVATIAGPALVLAFLPMDRLEALRWWLAGGWVLLSAAVMFPQRIADEERLLLSRILQRIYAPVFVLAMHWRWLVVIVTLALVASIAWPLSRLGSEFMPPLEEGDLLYMPTTDPGISMTKARELLQQTDRLIMQFPEVKSVFGKAGRAETATDPAPPSMFETIITLHRDEHRWRHVPVERFFSGLPRWLKWLPSRLLPESRPLTTDELVYGYELPDGTHIGGLNDLLTIPGLTNSWTMPIITRIDMLATGIRTPVGIKVMGPELETLSVLAERIAQVVLTDEFLAPYTTSAFPEKAVGGKYLDIRIDREAIARYALTVGDVQDVIMSAVGGMNVSATVEGLERYPINVRYPHELRDNIPALKQALVVTPSGAQVPLGQLASFTMAKGPPMIKSENARLTSWVYVDITGIDVGTYVARAQRAVTEGVELPSGYSVIWSGQYEYMQAARARLAMLIPLAGLIIVVLLYMATRSWLRVGIVLLSVPMSLIGAFWLLWILDYNLSVAVWVGMIALAGLDAETGLVLLLYLDLAVQKYEREGRMRDTNDLWHAIYEGAVARVRPKTMTTVTTFVGLLPLLWATGAGADTMRRLAAPMVGGLTTGYLGVLIVFPVVFYIAKRVTMSRASTAGSDGQRVAAA